MLNKDYYYYDLIIDIQFQFLNWTQLQNPYLIVNELTDVTLAVLTYILRLFENVSTASVTSVNNQIRVL